MNTEPHTSFDPAAHVAEQDGEIVVYTDPLATPDHLPADRTVEDLADAETVDTAALEKDDELDKKANKLGSYELARIGLGEVVNYGPNAAARHEQWIKRMADAETVVAKPTQRRKFVSGPQLGEEVDATVYDPQKDPKQIEIIDRNIAAIRQAETDRLTDLANTAEKNGDKVGALRMRARAARIKS